MQAPSAAVSVAGTPASTNTVASAVTQVVHALAVLVHGVTADAKLSVELTGHTTGGGFGGGLGGGSGGGGNGHEPRAASDAAFTPSAMMLLACELMQTPSNVESEAETPASTNTVASAVAQVVHAVAVLAQGVTAEAKLCCAVTGHASGGGCGGGLGGGSGGGEEGHEPIATNDSGGTPSATM